VTINAVFDLIGTPEQIDATTKATTPDPDNSNPRYQLFINGDYRQEKSIVVIFMLRETIKKEQKV
jgi:hypothetical protein